MNLKLILLAILIPFGSALAATAAIGVSVNIVEGRETAYNIIIECEYEDRTDGCAEAWEEVKECEYNGTPPEDCYISE